MNDIIDALIALLEPSPAATLMIDRTCAPPIDPTGYFNKAGGVDYTASMYAYPTADDHRLDGASPCDVEYFEVTVLYVVDDEGEQDAEQRTRDVSDALDTKGHDYLALVRANRNIGPWDHLQGRIDYGAVARLEVRGIAIVLTGYRYVPGCS